MTKGLGLRASGRERSCALEQGCSRARAHLGVHNCLTVGHSSTSSSMPARDWLAWWACRRGRAAAARPPGRALPTPGGSIWKAVSVCSCCWALGRSLPARLGLGQHGCAEVPCCTGGCTARASLTWLLGLSRRRAASRAALIRVWTRSGSGLRARGGPAAVAERVQAPQAGARSGSARCRARGPCGGVLRSHRLLFQPDQAASACRAPAVQQAHA